MAIGIDRTAGYRGLVWREDPLYAPLALALIQSESGGDPDAISDKGARGLMQLMPVVYGEEDPFNPAMNVAMGVEHLKSVQHYLHQKYPDRIPDVGTVPDGFARRVLVGAWVKGHAPGRGISDELDAYKGNDWAEFLRLFPSWEKQAEWIEKVSSRVSDWQDPPSADDRGPEIGPGGEEKEMDILQAFLLLGAVALAASVWLQVDKETRTD